MRLSIVSTLYQSAHYIREFHERITAVAQQFAGNDYEIVLVNDASPDNSLDIAVEVSEADEHVTVVDLSRNFGHHKAMMTGLEFARGQLMFLIDSDLEEQPEWLMDFAEMLEAEQSDVAFGVQETRRGNLVSSISGTLYYRLFRLLTGVEQPDNIVTARLMSRRYVCALLRHKEREVNIGGLWTITGFKQRQVKVAKGSTSPTTYSFSKKVSHLVNAVTSFSSFPLVFTFYSGLLISLSAVSYITYLIFMFLFIASPPGGYTSLIVSIWFFSGLVIFFLGVQGIYIAKIFSEVKQRPYTIVRNVYGGAQSEAKSDDGPD